MTTRSFTQPARQHHRAYNYHGNIVHDVQQLLKQLLKAVTNSTRNVTMRNYSALDNSLFTAMRTAQSGFYDFP